jgi:hypothetical protein
MKIPLSDYLQIRLMRVQALLAYWFLTLSGMQEIGDQCKLVFDGDCGMATALKGKKTKFSSYIRKFGRDRVQSLI